MQQFLLALFILLVSGPAQARVFDINQEKFASYFLATGGPSAVKQAAFINEVNAAYTYDKEVGNNYTGEFGFLYSTPHASLRFGFEIFKPFALTEVVAQNAGVDVYTLKSDITGYAPKLGLELNLYKSKYYRAFLLGYVGSASVSYKNEYTTHTEEAKSSATLSGGSLGFEGLLTDTTTFILEGGYRSLNFLELNYANNVTTGIDGAAHAIGDPVLDINGDKRSLNFSGMYLSVGFRFYL